MNKTELGQFNKVINELRKENIITGIVDNGQKYNISVGNIAFNVPSDNDLGSALNILTKGLNIIRRG